MSEIDPNYIQICENMQPSSTRRIRISTRTTATTANVIQNDPQTMISKHFIDAFKRIIDIFQDNKLCDVTLICKDDVKIRAHRIILSSVSDYFKAMFTSNLSESFKSDIEMTDMDGNALKSLVDFIYSG
jgi:kelch-like protein 1/4/5